VMRTTTAQQHSTEEEEYSNIGQMTMINDQSDKQQIENRRGTVQRQTCGSVGDLT